MAKYLCIAVAVLLLAPTRTPAQGNKPTTAAPARPATGSPPPVAPARQPRAGVFDLSGYGVEFAPDERLIIVLAALDAAGFEPTPGKAPTAFRAQLRQAQATLEPELQRRLQRFYELTKLPGQATAAAESARYVSLAFALGPAPEFAAPARTDDLFPGVLDVLDFAPLVREFYRKSGIEARMAGYFRQYQAAGDSLRPLTAETVRATLAFLHTRPTTSVVEKVALTNPTAAQKRQGVKFTLRERERRFVVVPDLLAAPGAVNLRVVRDDYFLVIPLGGDSRAADLRRAYLQFLIDPLVLRNNRAIAARRADLRTLLGGLSAPAASAQANTPAQNGASEAKQDEERERFIESTGPRRDDVFTPVTRSLVAATDVQMSASARLQTLTQETSARLQKANESERAQITQELQMARTAVEDERTAQLADAYERGAVLAFYFAEQLRDQELAGFDVGDLFGDMITNFDVAREGRRPAEYAAARARAVVARQQAQQRAAALTAGESEPALARRALLVKSLDDANALLRVKKYDEAETRLKTLMQEYQSEPRVFFALAQVASSSAQETFDEALRGERLGRALANYRFAVEHAALDNDSDRALASRAHTAMGHILAFLDRRAEALQEFDAALGLGDVANGAYREAKEARDKLQSPPM